MKKNLYTLATAGAAFMALTACGASVASTAASAQQDGMAGQPSYASAAPQVQAPVKVAVSAAQAIATAQKQAGGQATELHLKGKYGTPVYEVEVRNGQREHTVYVDAASGKVLGNKVETEWKPLRQTAVSLERAISIAQGKINGRILEAERDTNRGQVVYKVEILSTDNVPYKVIVDADNGSVLASFVDYDD